METTKNLSQYIWSPDRHYNKEPLEQTSEELPLEAHYSIL
jgi:hypothetical protein